MTALGKFSQSFQYEFYSAQKHLKAKIYLVKVEAQDKKWNVESLWKLLSFVNLTKVVHVVVDDVLDTEKAKDPTFW